MTEDDYCEACAEKLVSSTELRIGYCVFCMENFIEKEVSHNETVNVLQQEIERQREALVDLKALIEMWKLLEEIKENGRQAATRGIMLDENPHTSDSGAYTVWNGGWAEVALLASYQRQDAMILRTLEMLETVEEISKGYGQQEIFSKLESITSLLKEYKS